MRLDIIGDIHGQFPALKLLGRRLGYRVDGDWSHPEDRRLVFLGDLIDRGPDSLAVAQLVLSLVERDRALCLMGNHELNLVEWRHGRTGPKSSNQVTIEDIQRRPLEWAPVLDFFQGLPLAAELEGLRLVHAVWHKPSVDALGPLLRPGPGDPVSPRWAPVVKLYSPFMLEPSEAAGALRPGLPAEDVVDARCGPQYARAHEILLKGYEEPVPEPFQDSNGTLRERSRAPWWEPRYETSLKDRRVVFGHYWNAPPFGVGARLVPPVDRERLDAWLLSPAGTWGEGGALPVRSAARAVCVDYNGLTRAAEGVACVGAYRHPEAELVWAFDRN